MARGKQCYRSRQPETGERSGVTKVVRLLRRLLFVSSIVLGLAFAAACYAEMFGVLQLD
jgi:hypothetical protein